ncbi:MAG: chemotaxis protein CheB [Fibrobacteria bacterium]
MTEVTGNPGKADSHKSSNLTVVGIGASAGGLEAFTQILKHMPANTGMAFVLVQHLDPTHPSHLSDILSKTTRMPVTEVHDGLRVEPDQVYVIPPNTNMALSDGVLHLTPRGDSRGVHLPIDFFLRSLAQDRNRHSIGVILSGTGNDGTLGLAEIKAVGGITFAQDEASAKFPGMPLRPVAEGYVDLVLPPEAISRELARIGGHPYLKTATTEGKEQVFAGCENEFTRIIDILHTSSGVDFTLYRDTTLKRRILRRMALVKEETLPGYLTRLENDPDEANILYRDILIHVTRFFRDSKAFEALSVAALPEIWKGKSADETIRVWVAGCASGEEAYSLAIILCEFQDGREDRHPLRIFASDISESPSLDKARSALYPENIENDVSPDRLRRFFTKESGGYRINKDIRDMCIFAKHDVTADPPFARLDLISCRNVLIYLSTPLQRRTIRSFHYALNEGGFMLLGNSETVGRDTDLFADVDSQNRIYSRKIAALRLPILSAKGRKTEMPAKAGTILRPATTSDFQQAADRIVIRRFAPPGVLVNKDMDVLQFRGRTSPFLEPPQGGTGLNIATMAQESLSMEIRRALLECGKTGLPILWKNSGIMHGGTLRLVDVEVHPVRLPAAEDACFLVLFNAVEDAKAVESVATPDVPPSPSQDRNRKKGPETEMISVLRSELAATRDYLQTVREHAEAVNEELKASGEEMESSNEELQSTNEELETAKEELQSGNEELATMNEELRTRNLEQAQLNDDLSNLLSSVQIPILILGGDLRLRRFTPSAGKLLHLNGNDVGRTITTLKSFNPDLDLGKSVSDVVASQEPSVTEMLGQDGRWYALRIHPYRSSDNKIDGVVIVSLDIDEIKVTQQRLQESGDYARSIVDTVRDPMVILEADLRIHSANLSYYRFFGTTPMETEGKKLADVNGGLWGKPETLAHLAKMSATDTASGNFEISYPHPDGLKTLILGTRRLHSLSKRGSEKESEKGSAKMTLLAIEDATDRKQAEAALLDTQEKLRQSQRMEAIGKLAGGIAHDFNNLLTAINGFSALGIAKVPPNDDLHGYFEEILKAGEQAALLTRQLLAYSRKQMLAPKLVDLNGIVSNMQTMLARLVGARFQLLPELEDRLCLVKVDPGQVEQVLINLVVNARDAMPLGGPINLRTRNLELHEEDPQNHPTIPRGSYAEITVKDKGTGMDAGTLNRLFEPFFTTKELGKGTGLGLSVVQGIVNQSEGFIIVESTIGVGTEFCILLPRDKSGETTTMPRRESTVMPKQRKETVLLVDDEDAVRLFTRKILQMQGYTVLEANSAENAMVVNDRHKGTPIHILITDLVMPGMGGGELAMAFRASRPDSQVLFMSGYTADSDFPRDGLSQTPVNFIQKPFSPSAFASAVDRALGEPAQVAAI